MKLYLLFKIVVLLFDELLLGWLFRLVVVNYCDDVELLVYFRIDIVYGIVLNFNVDVVVVVKIVNVVWIDLDVV